MAILIIPSAEYEKSYREALAETQGEERTVGTHLDFNGTESFEKFILRLCGYKDGQNLPDGFVRESVFWLVDQGEFIGRVSIRHELTEHLRKIGGHIGYKIRPSKRRRGYGTLILSLALKKARTLGLKQALITCDETNIASRKIIEHNGGVLEDKTSQAMPTVRQGNGKPDKLRFWIEL